MRTMADGRGRTTAALVLPADHPGFSDEEYRRRRAEIAAVGQAFRSGDAIPDVSYSRDEDDLWRVVSRELAMKHRRYACAEYLEGAARLHLPGRRVPQLREV